MGLVDTTRRLPAAAIAAAMALLWLAVAPPTPDLAAAVYRAEPFAREGFQLYDSAWFGGHHMPGYSLLSPAVSALLGVRLAGAAGAVVSALLFERLASAHWGTAAARPAAVLYAIATVTNLLIGRVAFSLGVAAGLGALLALQRGRPAVAAGLAVACSATSPVAGLFLALAATAAWLARREDRAPLAVAGGALACVLALAVAFPEGGRQPCSTGALVAVLVFSALVVALVVRHERVIVAGAALYAVAGVLSYVVATPMGGNVSRLGAEFGVPLAVGALAARPRHERVAPLALAVAFVPKAAWQWMAPVRETSRGIGDPSYAARYYAPLIAFLERDTRGPARVEVPFTRAHWEAVHLAARFPLARGWQTQLDVKYNEFFRERRIGAARYRSWLRRNAVAYVALPDAPLDPSGRAEARLIRAGVPYLEPAWSDRHWRVFRVRDPQPLVTGPARLVELGPQAFVLDARRRGSALVRVRWTPYWTVVRGGCVQRAGGDWTRVALPGRGRVKVTARFSLGRVLARSRHCTEAADVPR